MRLLFTGLNGTLAPKVATAAAHRGWQVSGWDRHRFPPDNISACHTFLAEGCVRIGEQQLDGREEIEVVLVPFAELRNLVKSGQITHALVVAALYLHELGRS